MAYQIAGPGFPNLRILSHALDWKEYDRVLDFSLQLDVSEAKDVSVFSRRSGETEGSVSRDGGAPAK